MYFIYFLRSVNSPDRTYIGSTENLAIRLQQHNDGTYTQAYTRRHRPWALDTYVLAETREVAEKVEAYFKNASGKEKLLRFAQANPEHPNPIQGFFESQEVGRLFGRRTTGFTITSLIPNMQNSR